MQVSEMTNADLLVLVTSPTVSDIRYAEAYAELLRRLDTGELWQKVDENAPECNADEICIRLRDGSELHGAILQSDGDYWWQERFYDPSQVTHWRPLSALSSESEPSAHYVQTPEEGNPSCHMCGAVMYERGKWGGKQLCGKIPCTMCRTPLECANARTCYGMPPAQPLPGTPEAEAQYERSTLQCAENIKAAQISGREFGRTHLMKMAKAERLREVEPAAASVDGGAKELAIDILAELFNTDPLLYCPGEVNKLKAKLEAYLAQSTPTAEELARKMWEADTKLASKIAWEELFETVKKPYLKFARLALAALRGGKG